jgi:hypothetical protein
MNTELWQANGGGPARWSSAAQPGAAKVLVAELDAAISLSLILSPPFSKR